MVPTIGRIVHYRLSAPDVAVIEKARAIRTLADAAVSVGNSVHEGDAFPAVVVRDNGVSVNLQVFLDGNDSHWATSRIKGTGPGTWSWPPRA